MKIAICDDEPEIAELIAGKIKAVYKNMDISIYTSAEELLDFGKNIDILFLDIQMDGQMEWRRRDGSEKMAQIQLLFL